MHKDHLMSLTVNTEITETTVVLKRLAVKWKYTVSKKGLTFKLSVL